MTKSLNDQEQSGLRLGLVARLWRTEIGLRLTEAVGVRRPTSVHALDKLEAEKLIQHRTKSVHLHAEPAMLPAHEIPMDR